MKRPYKLKELIAETSIDESVLSTSNYISVIRTIMKPITDTDGQTVDSELYDFMEYFSESHDFGTIGHILDKSYETKYGDLVTVIEYGDVTEALTDIQERSSAVLLSKVDDLARLYYALNLSYNPLYNKDATETHTQTGSYEDANSGQDSTRTAGTVQDSTSKATTGKRDGEALLEYKTTEKESVSPDSDNQYYESRKNEIENDVSGTDSETKNEVDYTATTTNGKKVKRTYTDFTMTDRSFGNLGVTKSTDLLQAEYDTRMRYGFWNYVYDICLKDQFMWGVCLNEH